jgi:lactoylglutathione lyase
MLRKIDCLMIRVEDIEVSATYYAKVFGLRPKWSGEGAIGLVFPDTDAEIVLHRETTFPHQLKPITQSMMSLLPWLIMWRRGAKILVAPFDITIGKCAVIRDPFGTRLCILDNTKGLRPSKVRRPPKDLK